MLKNGLPKEPTLNLRGKINKLDTDASDSVFVLFVDFKEEIRRRRCQTHTQKRPPPNGRVSDMAFGI